MGKQGDRGKNVPRKGGREGGLRAAKQKGREGRDMEGKGDAREM